ncbi:MAG: tetratricopeptide repeat protein [Candidatus Aminicenantes bacterium]|nr:tetratricopeptide repeat protein [Candidatus Aminicenantes bacterium]
MKKGIVGGILLVFILFPTAVPLQSQVDDATRIMEQNKTGVVYLVSLGRNKEEVSRGTGFVVGENLIITNYHIISQAHKVEGFTYDNKKVRVDGILGVNKSANLALLLARGRFQNLIIGNFDLVAPDTRLHAVGANEAGEISIVSGSVRSVFPVTPEMKAADLTQSVPLTFSGAPVIDVSGQVVGCLTVLDRGLKFVLPVNLFRSLSRLNDPVDFKNWTQENFFDTLEGSLIAGRIAASINDTGNAQRYLEKVVRATPNNAEAQGLLARVYSEQRDYSSAVNAYKKLIGLEPNRGEAHFELGTIYLKTQSLDEALAEFQKAQELGLVKPEIFYQLGLVYENKKDWQQAIDNYQRYLLTLPSEPTQAQFRLGVCAMEAGDYLKAIGAFQEALKTQPQDYQTNYNLAMAFQKAKQYEQAEDVLKKLIQFYPEDAASYYSTILRMYDEAGMNEKAIEAARKVIELNPQSEVAIFNLGILFQKLKRYDEAVAAFQQAIGLKPDFDFAWFNIGLCFYEQKRYREAIGAFQKYVEIVPDSVEGWMQIGVNHMMLKDFAGAVEPLKKAVSLQPDNGVALYNLAVTYLNLRAESSAREIYQTLVNVDADLAVRLRRLLQR